MSARPAVRSDPCSSPPRRPYWLDGWDPSTVHNSLTLDVSAAGTGRRAGAPQHAPLRMLGQGESAHSLAVEQQCRCSTNAPACFTAGHGAADGPQHGWQVDHPALRLRSGAAGRVRSVHPRRPRTRPLLWCVATLGCLLRCVLRWRTQRLPRLYPPSVHVDVLAPPHRVACCLPPCSHHHPSPPTTTTHPPADAFMLRNFSSDSPLEGRSAFAVEMTEMRWVGGRVWAWVGWVGVMAAWRVRVCVGVRAQHRGWGVPLHARCGSGQGQWWGSQGLAGQYLCCLARPSACRRPGQVCARGCDAAVAGTGERFLLACLPARAGARALPCCALACCLWRPPGVPLMQPACPLSPPHPRWMSWARAPRCGRAPAWRAR